MLKQYGKKVLISFVTSLIVRIAIEQVENYFKKRTRTNEDTVVYLNNSQVKRHADPRVVDQLMRASKARSGGQRQ